MGEARRPARRGVIIAAMAGAMLLAGYWAWMTNHTRKAKALEILQRAEQRLSSTDISYVATSDLYILGSDANAQKILRSRLEGDWSSIDGTVTLTSDAAVGDTDQSSRRTVQLTGSRFPNLGLSIGIAFSMVVSPDLHVEGKDEGLGNVHLDPPVQGQLIWRKNWNLVIPGLIESSLLQERHTTASVTTEVTTESFEGRRVIVCLFRALDGDYPSWERWWLDDDGRPLQVEYPEVILIPKNSYPGAELVRRVTIQQWND